MEEEGKEEEDKEEDHFLPSYLSSIEQIPRGPRGNIFPVHNDRSIWLIWFPEVTAKLKMTLTSVM